MNGIETIVGTSRFVSEPHLLFVIDGRSLDEIVSTEYPEKDLRGLVPTTLDWIHNEREQEEVWRRFSQLGVGRIVIPLLCCPDDLDFSCTIVVVDATFETDVVEWTRFGIDATPLLRLPSAIGSSVDWLPGVGPFTFSRDSYSNMVQTFEEHRVNSTDVSQH